MNKSDSTLVGFLLLLLALAGADLWVVGHDQFMLFLRINNYELIAAVIFILAYISVRLLNLSATPRFCYLAIFAAMNVALNPLVIHLVQMHLHSRFVVGRGDEELRSFAAGLVSFITGIISLIRIFRSRGTLRGLPFAIVGIIGGAIWAGFWAQFYIRFAWGMAHW